MQQVFFFTRTGADQPMQMLDPLELRFDPSRYESINHQAFSMMYDLGYFGFIAINRSGNVIASNTSYPGILELLVDAMQAKDDSNW